MQTQQTTHRSFQFPDNAGLEQIDIAFRVLFSRMVEGEIERGDPARDETGMLDGADARRKSNERVRREACYMIARAGHDGSGNEIAYYGQIVASEACAIFDGVQAGILFLNDRAETQVAWAKEAYAAAEAEYAEYCAEIEQYQELADMDSPEADVKAAQIARRMAQQELDLPPVATDSPEKAAARSALAASYGPDYYRAQERAHAAADAVFGL